MTSFKQIEANRRNARHSTGPITEEGKQRSRRNAVRHGLTAETVIGALEDAEDYRAFETAVIADYDAQSAVERELVLRLGSLLWQIRRATTMETGLFEIQAKNLFEYRKSRDAQQSLIYRLFGPTYPNPGGVESDSEHRSQAAISAPKAERLLPGPGAMPLGRPDSFRWRNAGLLGWSASKRSKPAEARGQFRIFNKAAKGFEHDPTVFV